MLLRAGETINPKKDYQFFETPDVAKRVVEALGDIQGRRVLEPSAGRGALADLAKAAGADVVTVEAWDLNAKVLRDKGFIVHEADFLQLTPADIGMFDAIVANPPFTRNADIRHIEHMLSFLKPGGVLSTITSAHWDIANHAHAKRFKQWIANAGVTVEEVPAGTFKESGTSVPTRHLIYVNNKAAIAA
jgi:predicted RNA methylase